MIRCDCKSLSGVFATEYFPANDTALSATYEGKGLQNNVLLLTEERCFPAALPCTQRGLEIRPGSTGSELSTAHGGSRTSSPGLRCARDPTASSWVRTHPWPQISAALAEKSFIQHPQAQAS